MKKRLVIGQLSSSNARHGARKKQRALRSSECLAGFAATASDADTIMNIRIW